MSFFEGRSPNPGNQYKCQTVPKKAIAFLLFVSLPAKMGREDFNGLVSELSEFNQNRNHPSPEEVALFGKEIEPKQRQCFPSDSIVIECKSIVRKIEVPGLNLIFAALQEQIAH